MPKPKLVPPLLTQALVAAGHGGKVLITDS
jgi:hypothetical protein